jgi:HTH-type transcriptional regulator/antitoxin HigA
MQNNIQAFPINTQVDFARAVNLIEYNRPTNQQEESAYEAMLQLVNYYDKFHHPRRKSKVPEILKELMFANSITQKRLSEILGTKQPNVSAILSNQRAVSKKQAIILGEYFSVNPSLFLQPS